MARQFIGPFVLAVGAFAIIGAIDILFYYVEQSVLHGVPMGTVLRLLAYKLPAIMVLFFPMAVLFAVMLCLIRMTKDSEIVILRSSGIHWLRLLSPLIWMGLAVSMMSFWVNEKVVPWANRSSEILIRNEIQKNPTPEFAQDIVFKDGERFFYIKKVDPKKGSMDDILMIEPTDTFPRVTTAKRAVWSNQSWILQSGHTTEFNETGALIFSNQFDQALIHVGQAIDTLFLPQKTPREMDSAELKKNIEAHSKVGFETRSLWVEYYFKRSIPMACLVFALLGIAYCQALVRSHRDWWGVVLSILVAALSVGFYFFMVAFARAYAKEGLIPAFWGAWLPNCVAIVFATVLMLYQSVTR